MKPGKFITLEGGEGVGKTTNMVFVQQLLEQNNIPVVVTREPGGTPLAEKIRQLLLDNDSEVVSETTELLLMFAARAQHIKHVIYPALNQGKWVLCDRFTDATYAYQGGGRNMDTETIAWLEKLVQQELQPDLTLLLDAPVETGAARVKSRGKLDRFESEKIAFFERVRKAYLSRAQSQSNRISIINADQPLESVQESIEKVITSLLR